MDKKKKQNIDWPEFIGAGLVILGIAAIAIAAYYKKNDGGDNLKEKSLEELQEQIAKECEEQQYEKAALTRDLIKLKQTT